MKKIFTLLLVLFVAVLILGVGCKKKQQEQQNQTVQQQNKEEQPQQQESKFIETQQPEEDLKCDENYNIKFVKNSCKLSDDKITVSLINAGRGDLEGFWMYAVGNDETGYFKYKTTIDVGDTIEIEIPLKEWSNDFGDVNKIRLLPMKINGSDELACLNQQTALIISSSCE